MSHPLGPAPFRFEPRDGCVQGAAFSRPFQGLTALIVLGSGAWLWQLWDAGRFGATGLEGLRAAGWFVLGWLLLVWTAWHVLTSRVRFAPDGIHQSWVWHKHMAYDDLAYARLIRVRGLEWLIAPRLYVRTLLGKFSVFYVSDPTVLRECERFVAELRAARPF